MYSRRAQHDGDLDAYCARFRGHALWAYTRMEMNGNVMVWDLETIPDLQGFAAANYLTGKTDAEIRELMGDKFPKHIYHSIVCIGALVAHRESDHWAVDAVGAPHIGERSEKELIQ